MIHLGLLMYYPSIVELALVSGVAISRYKAKVELNYENYPYELHKLTGIF